MDHQSSSSRVLIQPNGGLGNQLFQYAAGRSLAEITGSSLVVDDSWYPSGAQRRFELTSFDSAISLLDTRISPNVRRWSWRAAMKAPHLSNRFLKLTCTEVGEAFQPEVLTRPPGTRLIGYFQSWRYFIDIFNTLTRELSALRHPSEQFKQLGGRGQDGRPRVAVHIRRGDYLRQGRSSFHNLVPLSWYLGALKLIQLDEDWIIELHSDDPQSLHYLQSEMGGHCTIVSMEEFSDLAPLERVWTMAQANALIGANSSLSLWAGYLSNALPERIVFPAQWYSSRAIVPSDRFLPGWQIV